MVHWDKTSGPLQAALLDGHGNARLLDSKELETWRPEDGPLWVNLDEVNNSVGTWLAKDRILGDKNSEIFLLDRTWPTVRVPGDEQLFVFMRMMPADPQAPGAIPDALRFWIEPGKVITMGSRPLPEIRHLEDRLRLGRGPVSARSILLFVIEFMADQLADTVLELRPQVMDLDSLIDEKRHPPLKEIHKLHRQAIEIQRYADPERALLLRLQSLDLAWLKKDLEDDWRVVADHYQETSRELDRIAERIETLTDEIGSRVSMQMNHRVYLLTLVSVLFLPLSLLTSLLAVQISVLDGNILGARHPIWFLSFGVGLLFFGIIIVKILRRYGFLNDK